MMGDCLIRGVSSPPFIDFTRSFQKQNAQQRHLSLNMLLSPSYDELRPGRQVIEYRLPYLGGVCRTAFCVLLNVSVQTVKSRLEELRRGFAFPQPHGQTDQRGHRMYDQQTHDAVKDFFLQLAARFGEMLPSTHIRSDWNDIVLLPTAFTHDIIHRIYKQWVENRNRDRIIAGQTPLKALGVTWLIHEWRTNPALQHIRIRHKSKMECDKCVLLLEKRRACNGDNLVSVSNALVKHVSLALAFLSEYHMDVDAAREAERAAGEDTRPTLGHATFDFAKALTLPSYPNPPAALYHAQNVQVRHFGVLDDGTKEFYDYLFREQDGGTGADAVINMLDDFFSQHQARQPLAWILHADNTAAQNRNNGVLHYLLYTVSTRRYGITEINLRFLIPGHTHTRVDGGFGQTLTVLRRHTLESVDKVLEVMHSILHHSHARRVRSDEFLNWVDTLDKFLKPAAGVVKTSVQFRFTADTPWVLHYQLWSDDGATAGAWKQMQLLRSVVPPADLKPLLTALEPPGVPDRKQWLLYEETRQYISDPRGKDELCPLPTVPRPTTLKMTHDAAMVLEATTAVPADAVAGRGGRGGRGRGRGRGRNASAIAAAGDGQRAEMSAVNDVGGTDSGARLQIDDGAGVGDSTS